MGDPKPFRILLPLAAVVALFAFAPAAGAATTCTIESPAVLNVHMTADFDSARLTVEGGTIVVHNVQNAPVDCGAVAPTVNNIDTVFIIDDSAGGSTEARITAPTEFAPGKTAETGGFSNIEFLINLNTGPADLLQVFGTGGGDSWVFGNSGANFSADSGDTTPDSQLILTPMSQFDRVLLNTDDGDDTVSGQGGAGTGSAFTGPGQFELHAGPGNDTLLGGDAPTGEFLDGETGNDTSRGNAGDDTINDEAGDDTLDGGPGLHDVAQYHDPPPATGATVDLSKTTPQDTNLGNDTISNVEDVSGSDYADRLTGNAGPNILTGGQGPDTLDGRGGNDTLDGGAEPDTATFAQAPAGETVDLAAGSATGGDGTDTLTEVENLVGSPFADSLVGSALPNEITGLAGVDTVVALGGADKVDVRDGGPDTASCGTEIDTATADQKSVDAVNADCETVAYLPEPTPTPTPTNNPTAGGGTTTGTPVGGADGTGPGGPNDRELTFSLAGSRAQRVVRQKAVIVTATCPVETCAVVASATGKLPRVRKRASAAALTQLALKPVVASVAAGAPKRLKLRLGRAQLRALKAAVKARKRVKLTVTVLASDVAGNSVTRTQTVKVKR